MRVGLIGEAPHDTNCMQTMLNKLYPEIVFFPLLNNIHGSQLDQVQPTKRILRIEYQLKKPELVIIIRDLDALYSNKSKRRERAIQFNALNSVLDKKAIFLLHIVEIEAMILADIETFGNMYNCDVIEYPYPSQINNPKEELKSLSNKVQRDKKSPIIQAFRCPKSIIQM